MLPVKQPDISHFCSFISTHLYVHILRTHVLLLIFLYDWLSQVQETSDSEALKAFTSSDPKAPSSQVPHPPPSTLAPLSSTLAPEQQVPFQVLPPLMAIDELEEFKKVINAVVRKPSPSSSDVLDSVRKMVSQGTEPVKIEIETLIALASLKLFSKAPFNIFEDKEMQSDLKLLYQALLEKEEINVDNRKTLLNFPSSFEFNCYILGKVLANRTMFEANVEYIEKKTSTADLTLRKFDSNAERI